MSKIKLISYGATEEVTGSCHLLEIDNFKILIDCGFFQGSKENYLKNWSEFKFNPQDINALILTHAHLDHCGRIPKLVKDGYRGKIYATAPTIELANLIMVDNFNIIHSKAKNFSYAPLYSQEDLKKVNKSWSKINYYQKQILASDISFTFHNAGHILGASMVEIKVKDKIIIFTGDIGGKNMPLVKEIDNLKKVDHLIMETTYADRLHEDIEERDKKLIEAVQRVTLNNSTLLISVFAIERTQDILKVLNDYYETHLDFKVPVFLDSPLAIKATKIYKKYLNLLNEEAQTTLKKDQDIFNFPHLKISKHSEDSKKINYLPPPKIILAGSGMAEGGRIIHHLVRYLPEKKNNILFVGFQVPGTLGYKLTQGAFTFDFYNEKKEIKARVDSLDGFSAHGDQKALLNWLKKFKEKPKNIFLVHGNKEAMETFSKILKDKLNISNKIVKFAEKNILD